MEFSIIYVNMCSNEQIYSHPASEIKLDSALLNFSVQKWNAKAYSIAAKQVTTLSPKITTL